MMNVVNQRAEARRKSTLTFNCFRAMRKSESLNSYGTFLFTHLHDRLDNNKNNSSNHSEYSTYHPNEPNLRLSCTMAWNRHRLKMSRFHSTSLLSEHTLKKRPSVMGSFMYERIRLDLSPFGGSFVIFIEFCRIFTGMSAVGFNCFNHHYYCCCMSVEQTIKSNASNGQQKQLT
jgi:hypothetical protein